LLLLLLLLLLLCFLLHCATCKTLSSCDVHGPQDCLVVFKDLTQANRIDWLDWTVCKMCSCALDVHMCSFGAHCTRSANVCASCLAKEHSKRVQHHVQNVQQNISFRMAFRT
jgi:hypothetical protein